MTCIVGLVEKGEVYLGGDSAGSTPDTDLVVRKDPKVFKKDHFVFGFTTSFRMGQLIQFKFNPPPQPPNVDLFQYMVTDFIDELRKTLNDGGFGHKENNRERGGTFLVGVLGRLFRIESDYQVGEALDGYDAVGCGSEIAKGSLFATPYHAPQHRLQTALEAAERWNAGVRAPFNYVDTKTAVDRSWILANKSDIPF